MAVVISINAERRAGEVGFRIRGSGAWKASRTNSKAPPTDIGLDDLPGAIWTVCRGIKNHDFIDIVGRCFPCHSRVVSDFYYVTIASKRSHKRGFIIRSIARSSCAR